MIRNKFYKPKAFSRLHSESEDAIIIGIYARKDECKLIYVVKFHLCTMAFAQCILLRPMPFDFYETVLTVPSVHPSVIDAKEEMCTETDHCLDKTYQNSVEKSIVRFPEEDSLLWFRY